MELDPQLAAVIAEMAAADEKGFEEMSPQEAREAVMEMRAFAATPPEMATVEDRPGARIYRPRGAPVPAPVVLFFHGGGWTVGSIEFADGLVRELADASKAIWVSAAYRLAPENPYPAAVDDAWTALRWLTAEAESIGGDLSRLAVAGESSGANLAAALALRARDAGGPLLSHQYLLFPPLDVGLDTDSCRRYGEGFVLTREALRWFWGNYLGDGLDSPPVLAAPLRAPDLTGVAPATVVVAQYDPLRDDGVAYARRLEAADVPVALIEWEGMTHGAIQMTGRVERARELVRTLGELIGAGCPSKPSGPA